MFQKILVAYDGSACGSVALEKGADLAKLCDAELHLLGIVATTGFMALAEGAGSMDIWGMERERLEQALDTAAHGLAARGVKIVSTIREGDPEVEIINFIHEIKADLVVIGHTRKGLFSRWLVGSVGADLLANLPCSVLIVAGGG